MQDIDWITVIADLEQRLQLALTDLTDLRRDMEFRRSTRLTLVPEQLAMASEPPTELVGQRKVRCESNAPRARRDWTQQETDRLVFLWFRNVPTATIADELGRSPRGVESYASNLRLDGIPLPRRDRKGKNTHA